MGDGAPWWITTALSVGSLIVGGLIGPLIKGRADASRLTVEAGDKLRDDLMKIVEQTRTEAQRIQVESQNFKQQAERLFGALVSVTTSFSEFQNFVLRESISASIKLDQKDAEGARRHVDDLIGGARRLNITAPYWSKDDL